MTAPQTDPLPPARRAQFYLQNAALRAVMGLAMALPYDRRVPAAGWLVARIVAPLAGWRRRVRDNLALVLPDLPKAEVRRLLHAVPDNAGRTMIETYSGADFADRARRAPLSGAGLEAIEKAQEDGRPIIFVTGHFGNFHAARVALIQRGYRMGSLYRPMRNPYFNAHYVKALTALGAPMFEQGRRGMVQMVRHLRGGGAVGILTDLHAGAGEPLAFFGKAAKSSLVTAELALKHDALLVPVWGIRAADGLDFRIVVEAPIPPSDPERMTQEVNDRLEAQARQHLDQWFWIHRRWKTQAPLKRVPRADDAAE